MVQYNLFQDSTRSKRIEEIQIDKLVISKYNPRKSRSQEYVDKLAQRINANGYEITRALWAYPDNGNYEVFAGGTRLKASNIAGLDKVPCVIHEGFTDEEIVKLADEDNENDEYHEPVPITEVWASYKALADQGWTQERIAKAKGVSQNFVSYRVSLANLPQPILDQFINNEFLKERHGIELLGLSTVDNLHPWLTREVAMAQIVEKVIKDRNVIAKGFKGEVDKYNAMIEMVNKAIETLPHERLLPALVEKKAYTKYEVQKSIDNLAIAIAREKREAAEAAKAEAAKAEREAREAKHRADIEGIKEGIWCKLGEHLLYCGDTSKPEFYNRLPERFELAFADPPYNAGVADWDNNFNWQHDWLIDKADIVTVTPGIESLFEFAKTTAMPYRWSLASWITNGMTRGALGFGNWIYIALFSKLESIHHNAQDVIRVTIKTSETQETEHKGRKPLELMEALIEAFTEPGDWIIDPFAGSGSTLIASENKNRRCVTGERDVDFCKQIIRLWEKKTGQEAEINVNSL